MWAAGAGVVAAGAGLALAQLAAGLIAEPRSAPVVAVGAAFIDVIPASVREFGIRTLGTADKPVLVTGIVVLVVALGALAGLAGGWRRPLGWVVFGVLGLVGVLAAASRPDAGTAAVVPSVLAALAAGGILAWGLGAVERTPGRAVSGRTAPARPTGQPTGQGRRDLLLRGGLVVAGSLAAAGAGSLLLRRRGAVADARASFPVPRPPTTSVPAGADLRIRDLTPWRTANDVFYRIDTALSVPVVDPATWRLRIHGMVDRPLTLTIADLRRRRIVHRWVTLTCVSNEVGGDLVGNALWTGVLLDDLLKEAGVRPGADAVKSTSADGWTCGTPLSALTDGRASMLAFGMNGAPLPLEHGFPVRMVVPGLYGYVSATKWVVDIEVTRFDRFQAYWTTRGWSAQGPIKTASRIDVPASGVSVPAGTVTVAGVAWAQHRGVSRVEVRAGDGAWQVARLAGQPTKDSWRQWTWTWQAPKGTHRLQVRAFDGTGQVQAAAVAPPAPNGASGYHTIEVAVG
ncbi:molybdopterin-dependent oxidoreductase [Actinopolymorpha cephalotaxi]|uniref:Sulfite oxidase n=1 Tax=Actinopolymorpha cephalotaxi TaxID=504797 RepID=A0ABX2RYM0_9ACTN|nr:molybdopterin-dependent oxidoreductase [Actinopolymorpha cephalotaxi]NYH81270.1 sulfite oxidase [Actinopolymorpha cephalotaxi]